MILVSLQRWNRWADRCEEVRHKEGLLLDASRRGCVLAWRSLREPLGGTMMMSAPNGDIYVNTRL